MKTLIFILFSSVLLHAQVDTGLKKMFFDEKSKDIYLLTKSFSPDSKFFFSIAQKNNRPSLILNRVVNNESITEMESVCAEKYDDEYNYYWEKNNKFVFVSYLNTRRQGVLIFLHDENNDTFKQMKTNFDNYDCFDEKLDLSREMKIAGCNENQIYYDDKNQKFLIVASWQIIEDANEKQNSPIYTNLYYYVEAEVAILDKNQNINFTIIKKNISKKQDTQLIEQSLKKFKSLIHIDFLEAGNDKSNLLLIKR